MAEKQTDPIAKIDSKLSEYEETLVGELKELRQNEREVKAKLRQIKAMRRAGGNVESDKSALPAPRKAEVIQIAALVLQAGPLTEGDLKNKVASQLKRTHTLSGLSLRIAEALRTDRFEVDSSGLVRLSVKKTRSDSESRS